MKGEENGEKVLFVSLISKGDKISVGPDFLGRRLTEGQVCACENQEALKLGYSPLKAEKGNPKETTHLPLLWNACWGKVILVRTA